MSQLQKDPFECQLHPWHEGKVVGVCFLVKKQQDTERGENSAH